MSKSTILLIFPEQFEERKVFVQKNIYKNLGVRVDQVLQGHGTTNTGNIARRCFDNTAKFSEALEIDFELVSNITTILSALNVKSS